MTLIMFYHADSSTYYLSFVLHFPHCMINIMTTFQLLLNFTTTYVFTELIEMTMFIFKSFMQIISFPLSRTKEKCVDHK